MKRIKGKTDHFKISIKMAKSRQAENKNKSDNKK